MAVKTYKELNVWQKSRELAKQIYILTRLLPNDEKYGLSVQMRRAAVSIPSNIAEGFGRTGLKDYIHFLSIARGSTFELETQLILCGDFEYISDEKLKISLKLCKEVSMMLNALITKLSGIST